MTAASGTRVLEEAAARFGGVARAPVKVGYALQRLQGTRQVQLNPFAPAARSRPRRPATGAAGALPRTGHLVVGTSRGLVGRDSEDRAEGGGDGTKEFGVRGLLPDRELHLRLPALPVNPEIYLGLQP